jgi:hypothetical protein
MPGWLFQLLYSNLRLLCPGGLYLVIVWGAMLFAYQRNAQLPDDSPEKHFYHPLAILVGPFTLPVAVMVVVPVYILFLFLRSLLLGIFLILFPFILLVFRDLGIIEWLLEKNEWLGRNLFKLNMLILHLLGLAPVHR